MIIVVEYLAREFKQRKSYDIRIFISPSNGLSDSRSCGCNKGIRRSPLLLCGDRPIYLVNCF